MKEKFGGLRFYTELESDEHKRLIQQVENNSFDLCQECGSKEDIQRVGTWYKYLCKTCRNES
jgi:predicted SprT family Zn-dependent metalloprotease